MHVNRYKIHIHEELKHQETSRKETQVINNKTKHKNFKKNLKREREKEKEKETNALQYTE